MPTTVSGNSKWGEGGGGLSRTNNYFFKANYEFSQITIPQGIGGVGVGQMNTEQRKSNCIEPLTALKSVVVNSEPPKNHL